LDAEEASMEATRVLDGAETFPAAEQTHFPEDATVDSTTQHDEISVLGDYELLEKIGEGAMGEVWKARQISFDRIVALKVLFSHVANIPKLVERLYREGRVMGQLDHANLVQAYGIGEDQGYHFVAMELVEGDSLQRWLNRLGRIDLGDALRVTLDVAHALDYAHKLNLVHRDIKPDNILITRQGIVKVADLGMVKTTDEDMGLTQTGHAVGTPWYMPLEQARNAKESDGRCDIYALGCTLYCMLTGAPPFAGRTIVEVIQAKELGSFPPARSRNPDVPERLDLLLLKMCAKTPKYRYQNCGELIADLERLQLASDRLGFLEGKPAPAKPAPQQAPPAPVSKSVEEPDVWYVKPKGNGGAKVSRLTTEKIKKLLEGGALSPSALASKQQDEGFRALAAFKEFEGTAGSKASRRAADTQGSRFRNLIKKVEEQDRQREEKQRDIKEEKQEAQELLEFWEQFGKPALYIGGGVIAVGLLWYILSGLFHG